jgi:hypothetical protein
MDEWRIDTPPAVPDQDNAPTPHEDVERKPDGVPHEVIGQTAFIAFLCAAMAALFLLFIGGAIGVIAAVALLLVGAPLIISRLSKKAQYERVAHGPHG